MAIKTGIPKDSQLVVLRDHQKIVDKDAIFTTKEFLESLIDEDDCSWDHNHSCQTHM